MKMRLAQLALFAAFVGLCSPALALDSKKALHVGGTMSTAVPERTEGYLNTKDDTKLIFVGDEAKGMLEIPYKQIDALEYGQKASHRIKTAIFLTPLSLFSKKRQHFLSIMFKDKDAKDQAVVFELGKDVLRPAVLVIETRSGKKIQFQDEEAQKHFAT